MAWVPLCSQRHNALYAIRALGDNPSREAMQWVQISVRILPLGWGRARLTEDEAIGLLRSKQQPNGTWLLEKTHPGKIDLALEHGDGRPSRSPHAASASQEMSSQFYPAT